MKSVLLSIRPKWCELIASGKKTVEIRKTKPKIETPFKCYIYCTLKDCKEFFKDTLGGDVAKWNKGKWTDKKGKVIGEFICDCILNHCEMANADLAEQQGCIKREKLFEYAGKKELYGWHISDLVIYDKPKELREFHYPDYYKTKESVYGWAEEEEKSWQIKRPPQSWCYVEEEMEK